MMLAFHVVRAGRKVALRRAPQNHWSTVDNNEIVSVREPTSELPDRACRIERKALVREVTGEALPIKRDGAFDWCEDRRSRILAVRLRQKRHVSSLKSLCRTDSKNWRVHARCQVAPVTVSHSPVCRSASPTSTLPGMLFFRIAEGCNRQGLQQ